VVLNLVPEKYQGSTRRNESCGLAGNLAVIMGLVAFSDDIRDYTRDYARVLPRKRTK
jgi:hypothetical protein